MVSRKLRENYEKRQILCCVIGVNIFLVTQALCRSREFKLYIFGRFYGKKSIRKIKAKRAYDKHKKRSS